MVQRNPDKAVADQIEGPTGFAETTTLAQAHWAPGTAMARTRAKAKRPLRAKPRRRRIGPRAGKARPRGRTAPTRLTEAALAAYAHDIRTALTGILALGELLATSGLGEREHRWATDIKAGAEHLASLTTLVVDAAKAEAGALTLQQEAFRPRRLIDDLTASLTARAVAKGLYAQATIDGVLPELLIGDPVRLRAALENLIDNAVKFTDRGGVRLALQAAPAPRARTKLVFAVSDSGIGLKPAEIKRLFRPFAQANPDIARRYGGAGLGLAMVKHLAGLMGGGLTVTSRYGHGSCFRFTAVLPMAPALSAAAAPTPQDPASRRLVVLCAEDSPYGRVILNTILAELGHVAQFVGSGEEAVTAVARGYDAVLMDVTLPGIDGFEATRRIRALPGAAAATPIIGISGRTETGDEEAARAAGMNFYLRKPLGPRALSQALAAAVPAVGSSDT
jgi:two-component system, sensor histidine kinase